MTFDSLQPYFEPAPTPLLGVKTIQIFMLREIHDLTVLRTEESRELNTFPTPLSISESTPVRRVGFLGSKQKAAESRQLEAMLRTALADQGLAHQQSNRGHVLADGQGPGVNCYLKDNLCLACPRCCLHGGVSVERQAERQGNIKHRIEYSTAYSLLPYEQVHASLSWNAVNEATNMTGQALGTRHAVAPATLFPSIVTLRSVTEREFVLAIKTLLACRSYGAESRTAGDVRNMIYAVAAGWEEIITALELTLELHDQRDSLGDASTWDQLLASTTRMAAFPDRVLSLTGDDVNSLLDEVRAEHLGRDFLTRAYQDVWDFRAFQASAAK